MRRTAAILAALAFAGGACVSTSDLSTPNSGVDSGAPDATPEAANTDSGGDAGSTGAVPTFIQANAGSAKDASAAAVALGAPVSPGNALVVAFNVQAGGAPTVDDSQSETFSVSPTTATTGPQQLYLAFLFAAHGGPTTITVHAQAQTTIELYAHEYANVASLASVVQGIGTTNASDGIQTEVLSTDANELLFGFVVTGSAAAGTNFQERSNFLTNVTEDRVVTTAGQYRVLATMKQGTSWGILGAALKAK